MGTCVLKLLCKYARTVCAYSVLRNKMACALKMNNKYGRGAQRRPHSSSPKLHPGVRHGSNRMESGLECEMTVPSCMHCYALYVPQNVALLLSEPLNQKTISYAPSTESV